jgi:hypothetical protein
MSDKGFIRCALCGAVVVRSSRAYGGMIRLVCPDQECSESESKAFA